MMMTWFQWFVVVGLTHLLSNTARQPWEAFVWDLGTLSLAVAYVIIAIARRAEESE